jgi:MarR family transcriptional regulator, 2-MHQ and catechol-resistance regulon repressor
LNRNDVQTDRREQFYEEVLRETTEGRTEFEREAVSLALNLALTYDAQHSLFIKQMSDYGLAKSSFNVLAILRHCQPKGMQLSEIGDLLITSRANITGVIDHLEQRGYVKRVVDSHDRRARLAKITKKGSALIEEVMPGHCDRSKALFQHFTLEEMKTMTSLLRKLRQSPVFKQAEQGPPLELASLSVCSED